MAQITIEPPALKALIAIAVEPYRQEAFGYLMISKQGKNHKVEAPIPFQTAHRKGYYEIEDSVRAERAYRWASQITQVMDGFHSHTYSSRQQLDATPTATDINDMTIGHFDIIVAIQKTKRKFTTRWFEKDLGLSASINGYRFLLRCWQKTGKNQVKELKLKA
jgi:proteasome lid subunit RPN8/RPN11